MTFSELPFDADDELRFGEGPLGAPRSVTFLVNNHTSTDWRFTWPAPAALTFTPSVGHLRAGASRPVTATFHPQEPVAHDPLELALSLAPIKYATEVPRNLDWDVALGSEEPAYAAAGGPAKSVPLRVYATADTARFECDLRPVNFRPTMMFQTRSHAFTVKNPAKASLRYRWRVVGPDGEEVAEPFSVRPEAGSVAPGATEHFTLRFHPTEVEEERTLALALEAEGADPQQPQLRVPLKGRVLRPWCHFDLPECDYLSSGRRIPGAPAGAVDATTRVIEFTAAGKGEKVSRRFSMLNPTSMGYEFAWYSPEPASLAPAAVERATSAFKVALRRGVLPAGKRMEVAFDFSPDGSDEPVEALWTFRIPDQARALSACTSLSIGASKPPHACCSL